MQPIAHPIDVNAPYKCSSQPRWSGLKLETDPGVRTTGIFKTSYVRLLMIVVLLLLFSGCVSLVYYEGSYHGKVIDATTLQPIEGAVVLGVWWLEYGTAGGPVSKYYDARETMTDANGEFTIKGMGPRVMTHLQEMYLVIFKAGYEEVGLTPWDSLKTTSYYKERVKWEGDKALIPLKKLSLDQWRRRIDPSPTGVPMEKHKKLIEEINRDRIGIK